MGVTQSGTATTGAMLAVLGIVAFAAGLALGGGWVPIAIGATMVGGGASLLVVGLRRPEPVLAIPPAHVTFYQRHERDLPLPPIPVPREEPPDLEPVTADDLELGLLETQIREVSRKINKATVMLGTGKLSEEGFKRYVDDLKTERADLEAQRVKIEMARSD